MGVTMGSAGLDCACTAGASGREREVDGSEDLH